MRAGALAVVQERGKPSFDLVLVLEIPAFSSAHFDLRIAHFSFSIFNFPFSPAQAEP